MAPPAPPMPVVLLPGLLCDAALWQVQVDALAPGRACHVADLTQDDTIDAMAARVLAAAPARFALCGLSMGGYVALAIMRTAPDRVERLCLMDTGARADTTEQSRRRHGLMALSERGEFKGVTPRLLPSLVHPDRVGDEELSRALIFMAARVGRAAFWRQQSAILRRIDSRPFLGDIAVPTAIVVGEGDRLTPPDLSREMAEAIPHSTLTLVPEAGHLPPMERPAATTAILRAWLENPPG